MKFTLSQVRRVIITLIFVVFAGGVGYFFGQRKVSLQIQNNVPNLNINRIVPEDKASKADLSLFWTVWDNLESKYLRRDSIDSQKMVYGAISGMVASLGDPYTVFLPPTDNKDAKADLRGDFEGVGIQIDYNKDQRLSVVAPLSGTPAEAAGLKSGDIITKILDEKTKKETDTAGISLPEAVDLIRGPKGSKVSLTIQRGTEKSFVVSLKRDTIVVKSVELSYKESNGKKVAIIKLSRFGERTYQEWDSAVAQIKSEETKNGKNFGGIIFDLRNNPGGFLQGAVFIGSEFLSSGIIVQQDNGGGNKEVLTVNKTGKLLKEPLVILINGGSASASEIVAGALQEAKRGKLVGEKSFGKGTVQEAQDLPNGAGLHVTVARWLLPSGKSIDKDGIKPDVEIKNDEKDKLKDLQLDKAIEVLFQL